MKEGVGGGCVEVGKEANLGCLADIMLLTSQVRMPFERYVRQSALCRPSCVPLNGPERWSQFIVEPPKHLRFGGEVVLIVNRTCE